MGSIPADDQQAVALVEAIRTGDTEGLEALLEAEPRLASARIVDEQGVERTLLHVASDWPGHFPNGPATVGILIRAGADPNARIHPDGPTGSSETPLHWAASSDDLGVLDALLDGGADIEAPGAVFTNGTAMSDAVIFAQWRAGMRLLERGAETTIWQAAALGQLEAVRGDLAADPPPAPTDITNALWHACRGGQLGVARCLVERGANVNWVGHDRKTPLDVARESRNTPLVQWLEDRGARSSRMT